MTTTARRDAAFLAAGLLATAAQVLLLRELIVDAAGDEAAIGIGLAGWFAGIAWGARRAATTLAGAAGGEAKLARSVATVMALLAVLPPLAIVVGRLLRGLLVWRAGELPGATLGLLVALCTLAPAGALVGRLFSRMAASWARGSQPSSAVARLYALECVGSLVGGLAVTLLAVAGVAPLAQAAAFGCAGALLALPALTTVRRRPLVAATACLALLLASPAVERWSESIRFAGVAGGLHLRAVAHTPYQQLASGGDEVLHLYTSGQYVASFPDPYAAESFGHLLALLSPRPRRVLLLGGLERGLVPVLLKHKVEEIVVVEPDRAALAFLEPQLPAEERAALRDPRLRLVFDDPRRWLSRSSESGRFDLVIQLGADPSTLLRARLATLEFYRLVAARLQPAGVYVVSLPAAPTVLAGETEQLAGGIVRTLREALPVLHATLANEAFAVAGFDEAAVTLDPVLLGARWRARGLVSPSFDAAVLPVLLPPDRTAAQEAALDAAAARAALSRDDRPVSMLHALARRQQLIPDRSGRLIRSALTIPPWLLAVLALLPCAHAVWRALRSPDRPTLAARLAVHAVAVTGAAGLGWSLLLMFSFQAQAGVLYGWLGVLVALFMAGLATGGALAPRVRRAVAAGGPCVGEMLALRRALMFALLVGCTVPLLLAAAPALARTGSLPTFVLHALLLLAAGLATGVVFPLAVEVLLAGGEMPGAAAARVEAADHAGAAVAALVGAVLFVPVLGLRASALLLAVLLAVPALAVALSARATNG